MKQKKIDERQKRYGNLGETGLYETFSQDIWQWAGEHRKVYWLCGENQFSLYKRRLNQWQKITVVEKIELPQKKPVRYDIPSGFMPPIRSEGGAIDFLPPRRFRGIDGAGPGAGINRRFDFLSNGEPVILVECKKKIP